MKPAPNLDRPIPPGNREQWASELAAVPDDALRAAFAKLFLFQVGAEFFGIDPAALAMTIPYTRPRRLPHSRDGIVEGVINADGRVIVCLSLARFAGVLAADAGAAQPRIIVVSSQKWTYAMVVDAIIGVEDVDMSGLAAMPSGAAEALRRCANGVVLHGNRAITCLDAAKLSTELAEALR